MGYLYKSKCLDTVLELHQHYAQDCNDAFTNLTQYYTVCTADSSAVTANTYSLKDNLQYNTVPVLIYPPQYSCDTAPKIAEVAELSWLVVGVWVAAWGIKKLIEVVRMR